MNEVLYQIVKYKIKYDDSKNFTIKELQKKKILRRGGKNTQKNCTKKIFMTQIIMTV